MVILDTSIIIDHLRLQGKRESALMRTARKRSKETLAISAITIQELYEGRSTADSEKEQYLLATISPLKILPYTYEAAKLAGEIARDLTRPIELADAAIAATALLDRCGLVAANKKDFASIPSLYLIE